MTPFEPNILEYCWDDYNFGATVANMLGVDDLGAVRGEDFGVTGVVTRDTDQSSLLHKRFYAEFDRLAPAYRRFVKEMSRRVFPGVAVYHQAVPTFRVQFPDNLAVGEFHRDSDYGHRDGALNVWVPLTPAFGSNTVWIETDLGARYYQPHELDPGQVLVFDGVNWSHGNVPNRTGVSRVSFDLRLLPCDKYLDTGARSVSAGRELRLGDYFAEVDQIATIKEKRT